MIDSLRELLLEYGHADGVARRREIEDEIWSQYGAERTVLVWDMSGFSLLTRRHGIVHYLSMVRRMQDLTRPVVHAHRGAMVKFEADNGFAVFAAPVDGVRAAVAMQAAFRRENDGHDADFAIGLSCGVDHGRILLLEGRDFFGDAVNIACKLGEDLAGSGEILVSRRAMDGIPGALPVGGRPVNLSLSGMDFEAVSIELPPS